MLAMIAATPQTPASRCYLSPSVYTDRHRDVAIAKKLSFIYINYTIRVKYVPYDRFEHRGTNMQKRGKSYQSI